MGKGSISLPSWLKLLSNKTTYLTWINFRVDNIWRFRDFFWLFAKINPRKIFEKCLFAKIDPREIYFKNSSAMLEICLKLVFKTYMLPHEKGKCFFYHSLNYEIRHSVENPSKSAQTALCVRKKDLNSTYRVY